MIISKDRADAIYNEFLENYSTNYDISRVLNPNEYVLLMDKIASLYESENYDQMKIYIDAFSEDIENSSNKIKKYVLDYNLELKNEARNSIQTLLDSPLTTDEMRNVLFAINNILMGDNQYSNSSKRDMINNYLSDLDSLGLDISDLRQNIAVSLYAEESINASLESEGERRLAKAAFTQLKDKSSDLVRVQDRIGRSRVERSITVDVNTFVNLLNSNTHESERAELEEKAQDILAYNIAEMTDNLDELTNKQNEHADALLKREKLAERLIDIKRAIRNLRVLLNTPIESLGKKVDSKDIESISAKSSSLQKEYNREKKKYEKAKEEVLSLAELIKQMEDESIETLKGASSEITSIDDISTLHQELEEKENKKQENIKTNKEKTRRSKWLVDTKRRIGALIGAGIMLASSQGATAININDRLESMQNSTSSSQSIDESNVQQIEAKLNKELEGISQTVASLANTSVKLSINDVINKLKTSDDERAKYFVNLIENDLVIKNGSPEEIEELKKTYYYVLGIVYLNWDNNAKVFGVEETAEEFALRTIKTANSLLSMKFKEDGYNNTLAYTTNVGKTNDMIEIYFNTSYGEHFNSLVHEFGHINQIMPAISNLYTQQELMLLKRYFGDVPNLAQIFHIIQEGHATFEQGKTEANSYNFYNYEELDGPYTAFVITFGADEIDEFMTKNAGESYQNFIERIKKERPGLDIEKNIESLNDEYIKQISTDKEGIISYELLMGYSDSYIKSNIDKITTEYNNVMRSNGGSLFNYYINLKGYSSQDIYASKKKIQEEFINICASKKENLIEFMERRAREKGIDNPEKFTYDFLEVFCNSTIGTLSKTKYNSSLLYNSVDSSNPNSMRLYNSYKTQLSKFKSNPQATYENNYEQLEKFMLNEYFPQMYSKAESKEDWERLGYETGIFYDHVLGNDFLYLKKENATKSSNTNSTISFEVSKSKDNEERKEKSKDVIGKIAYDACKNGAFPEIELPYDDFLSIFDVPGQASNYVESAKSYNDLYLYEKKYNINNKRKKIGDTPNILEYTNWLNEENKVFRQ